MPGTANSVVFGSRAALSPKIDRLPGVIALQARFQPVAQSQPCAAASRSPLRAAAAAAAAPKVGDASEFSVPARRAALLPAAADERIGEMDVVARPDERTDAFRAADLVGRERQEVSAERANIASDAAKPLAPHPHAEVTPSHARARQPRRLAE